MSGHNKWKQIKERKGKTDAYKSKAFAKYAKLIALEAKKSGGNREAPGVKSIIERARKENMPNDNIERALKKSDRGRSDGYGKNCL
jgi:transcriptional/translational regulatory protein YebC/TACO1